MVPPTAKSAQLDDTDDLAFTLVALLRADGHLCNVLTHVGSGNWRAVEQAIASILYPRATPKALSNIARNILQLICDNRGVTGPIMRSFFFDIIARTVGQPQMKRLEKKIGRLRRRMYLEAAPVRQMRPPKKAESVKVCSNAPRRGKMDDCGTVKNKLRDKRIYLSDGIPIGSSCSLPNAAGS